MRALIEPSALHAWQEQGRPVAVFDCQFVLSDPLEGPEYYDGAHIPGAHYAHLETDLAGPHTEGNGRHPLPPPAQLVGLLERCGVTRDMPVVVYDQDAGVYASRLWWMLQWIRHPQAYLLNGGLMAWRKAGFPVTAARPDVKPVTYAFDGIVRNDLVVQTGDLLPEAARARWMLVDARGAARFRGETEPFDAVAGHIPGAVNHPFEANLTKARSLRPGAELRADFTAFLGGRSPDDVVHYCGSGVSACHNALAMYEAGFELGRLYVGSWSAWIADPARPVAR